MGYGAAASAFSCSRLAAVSWPLIRTPGGVNPRGQNGIVASPFVKQAIRHQVITLARRFRYRSRAACGLLAASQASLYDPMSTDGDRRLTDRGGEHW
jgi:hypothetical protein